MTRRDESIASADEDAADARGHLWVGDTGYLPDGTRRAIVELLRGPFITATGNRAAWTALLDDETVIRSRLHELYLDLVVDSIAGFAFVRAAQTGEVAAPKTVRSVNLTFIDTAMLLVLRQLLLAHARDERAIVGRDEVFEQVRVFRTADRDEHDFDKRTNAAWQKMVNVLRVVHVISRADEVEVRAEISPVLRLLVDDETVRAVQAVYRDLIQGDADALNADEADAEAFDADEPDAEEEPS